MVDLNLIIENLIAGKTEDVCRLVAESLKINVPAKAILDGALIRGMNVVGERMGSGEMYIPEVLRSAKGMREALEILKPHLASGDTSASGKMVIGTVQGDVHDIGKNLVVMMVESAGFEVHDLGVDVPVEKFLETVRVEKPDLIGLSALLTSTMPMIKQTVVALTESGLRRKAKVMIGGAPVTKEFCDQIGADGYAADAGSAAHLAKKLVQCLDK
jgi:5-methyltetrahydrofolate--homocysteine methyltransferase